MKQPLERFVEWFGYFDVVPLALVDISNNCGSTLRVLHTLTSLTVFNNSFRSGVAWT